MQSLRSAVTLLAGTAMGFGLSIAAAATDAAAAAPSCGPSGTSTNLYGGGAVVSIGVPNATVKQAAGAGAVDVRAGTGSAQRFTESSFGQRPASHDGFGAAVTFARPPSRSASVNSNCAAMVVGAPGASGDRGAVTVAFGSANGLRTDDAIRLTGPSVGSGFGAAVAGDDDDLWVGAPFASVDGVRGAGAVYHYRLQADDTVTLVEVITENTPAVPGRAAAGDHFGRVLSPGPNMVAVGVPLRDVSGQRDAGVVTVLSEYSGSLKAVTVSQNSPGVPGVAEAGDYFGKSVALDYQAAFAGEGDDFFSMAVGVPGEDYGSTADAGSVGYLGVLAKSLSFSSARAVGQNSPGVPGGSEAGDRFGESVTLGGYFGLDKQDYGQLDIAVGVPGEDLGSVRNAGDVLIFKDTYRIINGQFDDYLGYAAPALRQGGGGAGDVGGVAKAGDQFGASLGNLDLPGSNDVYGGARLVVAVPGDDYGAADAGGIVVVGKKVGNETPKYPNVTLRNSAGPVAGLRYGAPASTASNGAVTTTAH